MPRRMTWALLPALVLSFVGSVAFGQPQPENAVTLAGQVDVARLVDLAAQRLKLNVEYDAAALKAAGQVTLRLEAGISDEELWTLTNRVLIARGFSTVRVPGKSAYTIVKLADASASGGAAENGQGGEPIAGYRVAAVRTKHRPAKELTEAVSKVLSKAGGSALVLKEGVEGLLLISDTSPRVEQALSLIDLLDVAAGQITTEEIPVRNYTGQQLATLAAQVTAKRELLSGEKVPGEILPSPDNTGILLVCETKSMQYWKDLIGSLDKRDRTDTVTYAPKVFPAKDVAKLVEQTIKVANDDRWKLVIDDLTGSLIITATPAQQEQVKALVERLDSAPGAPRRPMRSFVIRNRPVREIQTILDQLIQSGMLAADTAAPVNAPAGSSAPAGTAAWPPSGSPPGAAAQPTTNAAATAPATTPPERNPSNPFASRPQGSYLPGAAQKNPTSEVSLSSDEGTNTLIAMGEPRILAQIDSLLQTLDVRQPQVMLEVLILSLSDSQTLDLGVELEKLSGGETRTRVSSLFGLGIRDGAGNRTAGDGLGFTGVVLNPGDFSVVLRALQTLNNGRSLSMPRLLVTNNQQATLDSVLEQPYSSTNASNTVTTTSFGGSKPAGTQLTLKPQITGGAGGGEGDHLLLDYSVSLSAFVGAAANSSVPPPRQENKLQSVASLPDGHTVVVGGIELNADGKSTNQVPGLGSIPVLGELFKSRSNSSSRSRFYVFIRANILRARGFEDLKYMGEVAASQAGVDDGWPVVEPRVIR